MTPTSAPEPNDDDLPPNRDPASDEDAISFQLQMARTEAGLSVVDLSKLTGISKTVLHGYERGRTKPGAREIRLLSAALHVSPNRLILGSDEFESAHPVFTSVYRKLRARPALAGVLAMQWLPYLSVLFEEAELESVLLLLHSIIRSRNPALATHLTVMAEETLAMLDAHTAPDGALTIPPEKFQEVMAQAGQRVSDRLEKLKIKS